jgi:hypothetical protein
VYPAGVKEQYEKQIVSSESDYYKTAGSYRALKNAMHGEELMNFTKTMEVKAPVVPPDRIKGVMVSYHVADEIKKTSIPKEKVHVWSMRKKDWDGNPIKADYFFEDLFPGEKNAGSAVQEEKMKRAVMKKIQAGG